MNGRQEQPEFDWIDNCEQDIAQEALDILMDVVREMQLAANPIRVPPVGTTLSGPRTPVGQEERLRQHRERVANKLVRHRILRSARYFKNPGSYASDRDREGFEIEADEEPIREARARLDARLKGRPHDAPRHPHTVPSATSPSISLPKTAPEEPAQPPAGELDDPLVVVKRRTHAEERARFWYKVAAPVLTTIILGLAAFFFTPIGDAIKTRYLTHEDHNAPVPRTDSTASSKGTSPPRTRAKRVPVHTAPESSKVVPSQSGERLVHEDTRPEAWSPPPYASLKMATFRTHPIQFKLWGDSLIVDVLMEPSSGSWIAASEARPLMKFEGYSTRLRSHAGKQDEFTQEGQWIVAEKDRAVFVVSKDRVMFKNLRVTPYVAEGDSVRYPAVTGKWMRKGDPHSWYIWLKIDATGAVIKTDWHNDDVPPVF